MTILFSGGEPQDFYSVGGWGTVANVNTGYPQVDYTPGRYRAGFARLGVSCSSNNGNFAPSFYQLGTWTAATFWWSFRMFVSNGFGNVSPSPLYPWILKSADGVNRLLFVVQGSGWKWYKQNAAGTQTLLGAWSGPNPTVNPSTPDKIDIFVNYAVAGRLTVYVNGFQAFDYAGDITTDGVTALGGFQLGTFYGWSGNVYNVYSEIIVATADTRQMSVITQGADRLGYAAAWTATPNAQDFGQLGQSGASDGLGSNYVAYMRIQARVSGQVTAGRVGIVSGFSGNVSQMAVYADNAGSIGTRLALSNTVTSPSGLQGYTWTSGPVLDQGQFYWIAWACGSGNSGTTWRGQNWSATLFQSGASSPPATPSGASTAYCPYMELTTANAYSALVYNDALADMSTAAGQVQEYGVNPIPVSGNYSVVAVVQGARVALGVTGPTRFDFIARVAGTDYLSADISATTGWATYQRVLAQNPATLAAWTFSDLNDTGFNIGFKSVA